MKWEKRISELKLEFQSGGETVAEGVVTGNNRPCLKQLLLAAEVRVGAMTLRT